MADLKRGMLVRSKAGHDKNELFVIIEVVNEYVYLVNGKQKTLSKPKKKKVQHIQITNYVDENINGKQNEELNDSYVRKLIKKFDAGCE
ncbi:KOW domain-containing RNA-binding protein [Anaeromicropila populeti]|uniref:Ribosomal protein L14E/L6E/L27E n=1 Tax=Anaeromicropila populeti TaxID=37658 RepID=A0A1I6IBL1_9FIRM|nr:KOW domain-containing RNA-binding protein [Anaeromicropila populeti]SFR64215.1 hypothetical protein SAMN05661086_00670 [Anaeromicropila populeti]